MLETAPGSQGQPVSKKLQPQPAGFQGLETAVKSSAQHFPRAARDPYIIPSSADYYRRAALPWWLLLDPVELPGASS